jgi:molybdate transport system substrate-binding protein
LIHRSDYVTGQNRGTDKRTGAPEQAIMASTPLQLISSMATKALLADMAARYEAETGTAVNVVSVGGVDAAKRVQAGELWDVVMLASNAIEQLAAGGLVLPGSRIDVVESGVAVAVKAGAPHPDISNEAAVRQAVLDAPHLGYSTGPSGVQLARLFERWGIAEEIAPRTLQAPPGVPVGALVALGEVDLGFQQLSELMNLEGIDVLGPLPPEIQITTTFSAAAAATCAVPERAQDFLQFMRSSALDALKRQHGMEAPRVLN